MKKNLLSIVLGASIAAMGAGCAVGSTEDDASETEVGDARRDRGNRDDLPFIDADDLYHSPVSYFPPNDDLVSDEPTTSSDQEILSVDPNHLKELYAAAATTFAQCLVDEGMQFYGAWWCGPCKIQKEIFGKAWSIIEKENYTACSAPGGEGISQECMDKQIYGIPQARFDGAAVEGWLFLHQFEENFVTLPCHYDGPKIPNTGNLHKYVD